MSLVTQMLVAEKYGPLLSIASLADLLRMNEQTIRNQISAGEFPIPTSRQGGRRVAHYQDVAAYLDSFRSSAPSSTAPVARAA